MAEIPLWWLIVSGLCFAVSLLLNAALIAVSLMAWKKVSPLLDEARNQVHSVGEKATNIAATAQNTVNTVNSRTTHLLGAAEEASADVVRRVSIASAGITALFVAARIVGAVRGMSGTTSKKTALTKVLR